MSQEPTVGRTGRLYGGWFKSPRSAGDSDCVEVAIAADGHVAVRDSKHRSGDMLEFSPS